jgi:hypothetical protein
MVAVRRGGDALGTRKLHGIQSGGKRVFERRKLLGRKFPEHMAHHVSRLAGADPDLEPGEKIRAEMLDERLDAIVAASRSLLAKTQRAEWQRRVIVDHQDFLRLPFVKRGERAHRPTAEVHESLRLGQQRAVRELRQMALPLGSGLENRSPGGSQPVQQHETHIVAGFLILPSGISEADDETEGHAAADDGRGAGGVKTNLRRTLQTLAFSPATCHNPPVFGFMAAPCARCSRESFPAWRGAFCGLARCLGREFGNPSRLLVNRDAAFIGLLGLSLDPAPPRWKAATCCNPLARPFPVADEHPAILHAAAASVCGLAAKLADDSRDEGLFRRNAARLGLTLAGPAVDRAVATLNSTAFPTAVVLHHLDTQERIESADPLRADGPTAAAYATITAHLAGLLGIPAQRDALHRAGGSLGSLVYWRDAWQDRDQDARRGRFNPFGSLDRHAIRETITSSWNGFRNALGELSFQRHGELIAGICESTMTSRSSFLELRQETDTKRAKKRQRKESGDRRSCWEACDCCDCCECPRSGKRGCCDAACDTGPGDTGCCDCNPCDGCDCCPCN